MRPLFHFSWSFVRLLLLAGAALVLAFFILTRTEVGREGVRASMEAGFAARTNGTLEIGRLTGNLVGTLVAHDVVVNDATGAPLLTVERVVLYPSVWELLRRRIQFKGLVLYRPIITLTHQGDAWNIEKVFRVRPEDARPWELRDVAFRIIDGRVYADRGAPWPQAVQHVAGSTQHLSAHDVQLSGSLMGRPDALPALTVTTLSAHLPTPNLPVAFKGNARIEGARALSIDGDVQFGDSELQVEVARGEAPAPFNLEGRLSPRVVALFVPRPPPALINFAAQGILTRGSMDVLGFEATMRQSQISGVGHLEWSDKQIRWRAVQLDARVSREALQAVWPGAPPELLTLSGGAQTQIETSGLARDGQVEASWNVDFKGAPGRFTARGDLTRGAEWQVRLTARPQDFDLQRVFPRLAPTHFSGTFQGRLYTSRGQWAGDPIRVNLRPSVLVGRAVDTLAAVGRWDAMSATVQGTARRGRGVWRVDSRWTAKNQRLVGELELQDALLADVVTLPLDARATGIARFDLTDLFTPAPHGAIRLDVSHLALSRAGREVTLDSLDAALTLGDAGAFTVYLDSRPLAVDARGTLDAQAPGATLGQWRQLATYAVQRLLPASRDSLDALPLQPAARPLAPIYAEARVRLRDASVLALASTDGPAIGPFSFKATLQGDSTALRAEAIGRQIERSASTQNRLSFTANSVLHRDGQVDASLSLEADTLRIGSATLPALQLAADIRGRQGTLRMRSGQGPEEALVLSARALFSPQVTRVTIDSLRVNAGPYTLASPHPQSLQVYGDGVVLHDLTLLSAADASVIHLTGAVSPSPQDTLFARIRGLPLAPLTRRLNPEKYTFAGIIEADIALTDAFRQPEITGAVTIPALLWGGDLVGRVDVTSFYTPGVDDVGLQLEVSPVESSSLELDAPTNRVRLGGTFRLPRRERGNRDDGALNLTLVYAEADAFFFDHLFPGKLDQSGGRITGVGRIGGTLRRPLFNGQFEVEDARFSIPRFDVAFRADALASVDERGIHVTSARVRDSGNGYADISGSLLFNDYRYFSLDVTGELSRLLFLDVTESPDLAFYGTLRASGTAQLTGPLSAARLRSSDAVLTTDSEIFIPIRSTAGASDPGFILFADSTGAVRNLDNVARRTSVIGAVEGERQFVEGLDMDLSLRAPDGVTVNLVTDPLAGDVMRAVGSGRVQLVRRDGDFLLFGTLDVSGGDYLFTAGDVFVRRFNIRSGSIVWDGDPLDPLLDIDARYATRASLAGTPYDRSGATPFVPIIVQLDVQDRLSALRLGLRLEFDRNERGQVLADVQEIEQFLNQPDRQAEYATSVLLTNSFLLTTSIAEPGSTETLASTGNRFAFASVSQLVASQLNRYLSAVLPGVDLNLGLQGDRADDLDLTYGIALRLLDERLVIRGAGLLSTDRNQDTQGLQGEFVVEVRLSRNVSVEVFYRREEDILQRIVTSSTGAGVSYQTQFTSWGTFWRRLTGEAPPPSPVASNYP